MLLCCLFFFYFMCILESTWGNFVREWKIPLCFVVVIVVICVSNLGEVNPLNESYLPRGD